jgi:hypothetical protein
VTEDKRDVGTDLIPRVIMPMMLRRREVAIVVGGVVVESVRVALGMAEEVHADDAVTGLIFRVVELVQPQPRFELVFKEVVARSKYRGRS